MIQGRTERRWRGNDDGSERTEIVEGVRMRRRRRRRRRNVSGSVDGGG